VAGTVLIFAALLGVGVLLDATVRPRARFLRSIAGTWLLGWMLLAVMGIWLALCGNAIVSAILALAMLALFVVASNAKHRMLGEPLLFSDLALIGAMFRHPQFYMSTIGTTQRVLIGGVTLVLFAILLMLFDPEPVRHFEGVVLLLVALAMLALSLRGLLQRGLAPVPDIDRDTLRHGLVASLLLYWLRWRASDDPPPHGESSGAGTARPDAPVLVVMVQCESFADPVDLFGDPGLALPGLAQARRDAWQWGRLEVSGFGAYTMRTEYAALFGRTDAELGFRRYDPYLTALRETSYALPNRLAAIGWQSLFVHPHDMRFYGRDRIMPASGFADLVGEDRFASDAPREGRYITDAAVADTIGALAGAASAPTLIYAVTMENHGPWAPGTASGAARSDLVQSYLRLVGNSDAMLRDLIARLAGLRRPALLVFFGDHRPSIPGATAPGGARHTPYVIVRLGPNGSIIAGENRRVDITPAALHHIVADLILGDR